jgi:formylglycine-generating enzyme required for sulfatase activity
MATDLGNGGILFVPKNSSGEKYVVKDGFENKPVVYVSFTDAVRFANWLHNGAGPDGTEDGAYAVDADISRNTDAKYFLPNFDEWYKAAYYAGTGDRYFDYAAGSNRKPTCSMPTPRANRANCDDAVGSVTDVGAYPGSASPYETLDQGGNVREWTEEATVIEGESRRIACGASWPDNPGLRVSFLPPSPEFELDWAGFRIARAVPEPAQVLLVLTGGLVLAARRKGWA